MFLPSLRPMTQIWPPVLLGSQFVFNIGFMRLCPFSSVPARRYAVIRRRHRTGAWVAHFSQQGMFIVGGALSDRFGARIVILWGCFIRIAGFLLLALGHSLWPIVLGACLTGVGGALFSPLLKRCSLKRASKARLAVNAAAPNGSLFCRMRRTGRGIRPGIGALFAGLGFRLVAFAGAAVFTGADRALFSLPPTQKNPLPCGRFPVDRIAPAAVCRVYCCVQRPVIKLQPALSGFAGGNTTRRRKRKDLGPLFMLASLLIITFQLPLARLARVVGPVWSLPTGFALVSASFLSVAFFAADAPQPAGFACCLRLALSPYSP